jgi:response regulator RpfG family c-di-GMP phosphodiesterase
MNNPFDFNSFAAPQDGPYCVFLVEEGEEAEVVQLVLEQAGIFVTRFADEGEMDVALESVTPDLLLVGWNTEGQNGRALVASVKAHHPRIRKVPVIFMVDHDVAKGTQIGLASLEIRWILQKPIVTASLPKLVMRTITQPNRIGIRPINELLPQKIAFGLSASQALLPAVS